MSKTKKHLSIRAILKKIAEKEPLNYETYEWGAHDGYTCAYCNGFKQTNNLDDSGFIHDNDCPWKLARDFFKR